MEYIVIGAGSIGKRHHENLVALGARARLMGWRGLDLAALERDLAQGGRAMVIATATHIRRPLITLCAQHNVPFYVEKPVAFAPEDLAALRALAAPVADRSVAGFMMRYHPMMQALLARGASGTYAASFEIGHDVRQWRANWSFAQSYAARAEGGGVLLDLCHELDMAHVLFPALRLRGVLCQGHAGFPGVDFATQVTLAGPDAPLTTVAMDYLSPHSLRRLRLRGVEGICDLDFIAQTETRGGAAPVTYEFARNQMFLGLMADFMALAQGGTPQNPHVPRLSSCWDSCALIAEAWAAREFTGTIAMEMT